MAALVKVSLNVPDISIMNPPKLMISPAQIEVSITIPEISSTLTSRITMLSQPVILLSEVSLYIPDSVIIIPPNSTNSPSHIEVSSTISIDSITVRLSVTKLSHCAILIRVSLKLPVVFNTCPLKSIDSPSQIVISNTVEEVSLTSNVIVVLDIQPVSSSVNSTINTSPSSTDTTVDVRGVTMIESLISCVPRFITTS